MPLRHCPSCGCQTQHRHMHDCERSLGIHHIHGSERFECIRCGAATFAHHDGADRFPFVLDAADRRAAFSHAMVRP